MPGNSSHRPKTRYSRHSTNLERITQPSIPKAYKLGVKEETISWAQSSRKGNHEMTSVSLRTLPQCTRCCQVSKRNKVRVSFKVLSRCCSVLCCITGNWVHAPGTQQLNNITSDLMCALHMHMHSLQGVIGVAVSQRRLTICTNVSDWPLCTAERSHIKRWRKSPSQPWSQWYHYIDRRGTWLSSFLANYREIQHAVLVDKVVGSINVIRILQATVIDAWVCQAPWEVGTGKRFMGHLRDGHLIAKLPHVLTEEIGIAHVERSQSSVEGSHSDGRDLGPNCREENGYLWIPISRVRKWQTEAVLVYKKGAALNATHNAERTRQVPSSYNGCKGESIS